MEERRKRKEREEEEKREYDEAGASAPGAQPTHPTLHASHDRSCLSFVASSFLWLSRSRPRRVRFDVGFVTNGLDVMSSWLHGEKGR